MAKKLTNVTMEKQLKLVWISTINPEATLDSSTWIDTTRELGLLGWDVTLLGKGREGVHQQKEVEIECLSVPDVYLVGQILFYGKMAKRVLRVWRSADVVLFHQDMALAVLPLRLWRLFTAGPRFVLDTRDFADVVNGRFKTRLRLRFFKQIYRWHRLFADGQTTITDRMATYANVPRSKLLGTWPSGVDVEKFEPAHFQRQWQTKNNTIELIYIGSIISKRNHIELCRAVKAINEKGGRFRFTLYGSGEARAKIEAFATETGANVRVCDPVPHEQVPNILANYHIGVTSLPPVDDAKYMASSPIKLFEYMAAGMPILATANPCHVDVVANGRYGFWADAPTPTALETALEVIWQQREQLPELGREAYEAATEWTWHRAAVKLSNALKASLS